MATVGSPGCAVIPIPHEERPVFGSRPPPSGTDLAVLRVGSATRADVLLALGAPSERWNHDHAFVYSWTTSNLAILWLIMGGYYSATGFGGIWDSPIDHFIVAEFDDSGRLTRLAREEPRAFQPGPKFLDELRNRYVVKEGS